MEDRGWFSPPVALALEPRGGVTTQINNVRKAAEVLLYHWPAPSGPKHLAARKVCLDALSGKCSAEEARRALVEAAEEANLLRAALMRPTKPTVQKRQPRR